MRYYYSPMMYGGDWGYGGLIGAVIFVIFLALIALIVMRAMRHQHHHAGWPQHRDPLDIARDRYAKGEIDKEQFEQLKNDLKG